MDEDDEDSWKLVIEFGPFLIEHKPNPQETLSSESCEIIIDTRNLTNFGVFLGSNNNDFRLTFCMQGTFM
mgnify:CR=1 FL=1